MAPPRAGVNRGGTHERHILISILITFLVIILVLYLINMLPIDGRAKQIVRISRHHHRRVVAAEISRDLLSTITGTALGYTGSDHVVGQNGFARARCPPWVISGRQVFMSPR